MIEPSVQSDVDDEGGPQGPPFVQAAAIATDIIRTAALVAEAYGAGPPSGSHVYNVSQRRITVSITLDLVRIAQTEGARQRQLFAEHAKRFGLPAEALGCTILLAGERWRIVGINPHRSGRPVVLSSARGRIHVAAAAPVRIALSLQYPQMKV